MTNQDRLNLNLSYGSSLINEIEKAKKSIEASHKEYEKYFSIWDSVRLNNWSEALKIKKSYYDFLKNKV
jgi:abortive infection bacteriophage resistance protein